MRDLRVVRVAGGKRVELSLSAEHAQRLGIRKGAPRGLSPIYLLDPLLSVGSSDESNTVCSECGTSRKEVILRRVVGCEHCYTVFGETIARIIGPGQTGTRGTEDGGHRGRIPVRLQRYRRMLIDRGKLVERLEDAVAQEDYEQAADLRDQIIRIEAENGQE